MELEQLERVIEALLFVSVRPLNADKIFEIINSDAKENEKIDAETIEKILIGLVDKYTNSSFVWQILKVAGGYQFVTKKEFSSWIKKMYKAKFTIRLSPPALETLSIIAYKQPITKAEIEQIRGVDSTGVVGTLLERKLIKIAGHKEALGSPALYSTTSEFLKYFGLNTLNELPLPENIDISAKDEEDINDLAGVSGEENVEELTEPEQQEQTEKTVEEENLVQE